MNPDLLNYLCDPNSGVALQVKNAVYKGDRIESGILYSPGGTEYPIIRGVPRFVPPHMFETVKSFGDQWNHFNFDAFKQNWLDHTVKNTFGGTDAFTDKIIVDAGGGSGAQSLWMLESGARRVIMLELSHSVDDVVLRNIDPDRWPNFDVVQCSIDAPPIKANAVEGIVICHNVIQHTRSVEDTAVALYRIVGPGGEFVFNCYKANKIGMMGWIRTHLVYRPMRAILKRLPFSATLYYSKMMGALRLVPVLGYLLNKFRFCLTGKVPKIPGESWLDRTARMYRQTVLNTFDTYGSHAYQHHKSDEDIRALLNELQPDPKLIGNLDRYFQRPQPTGCALRVRK